MFFRTRKGQRDDALFFVLLFLFASSFDFVSKRRGKLRDDIISRVKEIISPSGKRTYARGLLTLFLSFSNIVVHRITKQQKATSARRVNTIVRMADQAAVSKALEDAIKNAQECVDDCAANWDVVEEISAASAHAKKEPAAVDAEVSKEDLAFIKASQDALKAAKSGEMDKAVLDSIETAAKSLGKVQGKVKESARVKELSKSLEIALKAAKECTEDCAVEWETVEEISDAKEREQAKGN